MQKGGGNRHTIPVLLLPYQTNHTASYMQPSESEARSLLGREQGENDA